MHVCMFVLKMFDDGLGLHGLMVCLPVGCEVKLCWKLRVTLGGWLL